MAKTIIKAPRPLELGQLPHDGFCGYPGQQTWIDAARKFPRLRIACGRQVGKSSAWLYILLDDMAHFDDWGLCAGTEYRAAYAAQGHTQASTRFELDLKTFESANLVKRSRDKGQDRWIELHGIGKADSAHIWYWSFDAEAHMTAQGKSLHRGFLDEASLVPHEAYTLTLRPMFNATMGKEVIAGTPIPGGAGFHWFEQEFKKGIPGDPAYEKGCLSFSAPSECNPFSWHKDEESGKLVSPFIEGGRASCRSRDEELCLYDGKFAQNSGAVFANLASVFTLSYTLDGPLAWSEKPVPNVIYIAGVDFVKHYDSIVVSIFRLDNSHQVALLRVKGDYMGQLGAIDRLLAAYNPAQIYAEGREGGTVLTELMRQRFGKRVIPVKWSRGGKWDKESSVLRGQDLFQSAGWRLINIPWQFEEFRLFSKIPIGGGAKSTADVGNVVNHSGWKYEAPSGCHDDSVAANLYAAYGLPLTNPTINGPKDVIKPYSHEWWELLQKTQATSNQEGGFSLRRRGW